MSGMLPPMPPRGMPPMGGIAPAPPPTLPQMAGPPPGGAPQLSPAAGTAATPILGQGLLAPNATAYPPPMPNIPGLFPGGMRPTGMELGQEQVLAILLPKRHDDIPDDETEDLPAELKPYAKGLRPAVRPTGAAWQQEIIYERLGKSDTEIESINRHYFNAAESYDADLSRDRVIASQYYSGQPFGDEGALKGRSQLVLTVVRDTIRSTLPSLLRVFTGVEDPVSFEPISSEITGNEQLSTSLARQATDYARWALFTANPGWSILHDALLDALTRKAGWVRWYWGKKQQLRTEVCEGLLLPQLQLLLAEPGIETQRIVRRPMTPAEVKAVQQTADGMMYLNQGGPPEYWSAVITRSSQQAWPVVEAVPSDCVWIVADAANVADARAVYHVRDVPASDLIEMGLPEYEVLTNQDTMLRPRQRREMIARDAASGYNMKPGPPNDKSMGYVRYVEGWIRCDADNDHKAELIHTHSLGNGAKLIQWERCDEIPLSCFTPYREPGRVIGSSQADMVMDLQRLQSRVMRATLDSLGQSMFPRTVMTLGQVNMSDVRQTAIGSIIRVAQQGAVTELTKPFTGKEALPIMQVLEAVRESRTGITRASQGLTVDELQSTAPIAVSQQTSAAQDRLDMMARTLAETGLAPLYHGLLKLMARHQDRPNTIRIRGAWIAIDPRALATQWEVSINVGGKGMPMERLAMLAQIAGKQEQIIATQGLNNPLVGVPEYRNTLARMLETANIADVTSYFKALPPGWQPPPPPSQPSPEQLLAMVQQQKTAADLETDRGKAQTDRASMLSQDERERDKAALDAWVKVYTAGMANGSPAPSLTEFQEAMRSQTPQIGLMASMPPPSSPQQPATGVQSLQQPPGGRPQGPQMGQPLSPNAANPLQGPRPANPAMPPTGSMDPANAQAVRTGLTGGGMPTAYGQLAAKAMPGLTAGMGGPPMPKPAG